MTQQKIEEIGRKAIADTLGIPVAECTDDMDIADDLGADSLDAVEMLMAVETRFDIAIQEGEADNIKTVRDYLDLLVKKVQSNNTK